MERKNNSLIKTISKPVSYLWLLLVSLFVQQPARGAATKTISSRINDIRKTIREQEAGQNNSQKQQASPALKSDLLSFHNAADGDQWGNWGNWGNWNNWNNWANWANWGNWGNWGNL